ncbi:hypothetical protein TRIP_D440337 [uncultured Paludibacter sp.]|uniref:Uncharacterized protein n=1 Tax=uncultured Paludibacter sp. TaxID=497635 RepID=A0A653AJT8_9BACT|nr:hypothetical protein TRIP_D440337 [uncultured Paludibacter sp.]
MLFCSTHFQKTFKKGHNLSFLLLSLSLLTSKKLAYEKKNIYIVFYYYTYWRCLFSISCTY